MNNVDLEGKTALVTGGASGIGLAIVIKLIREGMGVLIIDRNPVEQRAGMCGRYQVDVTDQIILQDTIDQILKRHQIDVLVNCAGIDLQFDIANFSWENWTRVLNTNLTAPAYISAKIAAHMRDRGIAGSIINIASVHIRQGFPGGYVYDASKHALVGFSRVLALEFGQYGIRCNTVDPGFTYPTGITGGLTQEMVVDFASRIPLGKPTTPEDVAEVVAFLSSNKAANITGASIPVDGGLPLRSALF